MADDLKFFTDGEAYEKVMGQWSRPTGRRFLDWLALPHGLKWLDIGCGTGAFTETVIERCAPAEIHAVDPADAQIAYARTRDAARKATFHSGDAMALPFENGRFDIAAMALVISFVPNAEKAVAEMARVVRPGGWVATYMWDVHEGGLPMEPFRAAAQGIGVPPPNVVPGTLETSEERFAQLWRKAGLVEVETCRIDIPITYADLDDFLEFEHSASHPRRALCGRPVARKPCAPSTVVRRKPSARRARPHLLRRLRQRRKGTRPRLTLALLLGHHLLACDGGEAVHLLPHLGGAERETLGLEIAHHLIEHVRIARLLEIGRHHLLGVGVRVGARPAELLGRPQPEQPVAARGDLELGLLVMAVLGLEAFFPVVEGGHVVSGSLNGVGDKLAELRQGREAPL